jgi:hypothetical protein
MLLYVVPRSENVYGFTVVSEILDAVHRPKLKIHNVFMARSAPILRYNGKSREPTQTMVTYSKSLETVHRCNQNGKLLLQYFDITCLNIGLVIVYHKCNLHLINMPKEFSASKCHMVRMYKLHTQKAAENVTP